MSDKGVKEIVQIENDWKTMSYENGQRVFANPNGNPYDNEGYYTQTHRWYDSGYDEEWNEAQKESYAMDPIERDAELYDQWYEMHSGMVMWFDTAACWKGKFIGDTTDITIRSDQNINSQRATDPTKTYTSGTRATDASSSYDGSVGTFKDGWYAGANYDSNAVANTDWDNFYRWNTMIDPVDASGPYQQKWTKSTVTNPTTKVAVDVYRKEEGQYRSGAWDTDVLVSGSIGWADTMYYDDLMAA